MLALWSEELRGFHNENGFTNEPFHFRMRLILDENRYVTSHQCWAGVPALLGKFQL
jgi:hypothetical protein